MTNGIAKRKRKKEKEMKLRKELVKAKRGEEKEKSWRGGEYAITERNLARTKGGVGGMMGV